MIGNTNLHNQQPRAELQPAAAELAKEIRFEKVLADLSARFVNVPSARVDSEIEDAQRCVCEYLGLDMSSLWLWSDERPRLLTLTHLYRPLGGRPVPERMGADEYFPWTHQQILAGKVVAISSMEQLPPEAARDKEVYCHYGVKATLTIPLSTGGELPFGALSFNDTREERAWPETLGERLQLVAQIFANALARKRSDQILRESEERLDLAADSAGVGLWGLDLNTMRYWITKKTRELFCFPPDEEVTFDRFMSLVHPDDRELVRRTVQTVVQSKEEGCVQYRITRPDGSVRWMSSRGRVYCNASGGPKSLMGVSQDITEQKQAEEVLRTNEARLVSAIDIAGLGFYEMGEGFKVHFMDDWFQALLGVPPSEEARARVYWMEHLHPDDRPRVLDTFREVTEGGLNRSVIEYRYLHPEQGLKWFRDMSRVLGRNTEGQAARIMGVLQDITERKRTEEALRVSEGEGRATFDQAAVGIAHVGTDGRLLRVNDKFCTLVGHDRDELLKMTFQDITHPQDLEADLNYMRQVLSDKIKSYSMEKRYLRKDGSQVWMNRTVSLARDDAGVPKHYISVLEDITERKRADQALQQSEERFRQVAETVSDFVWEVDADGLYTYTSPSVERILGYTPGELIGKVHFYDLFVPDEREQLKTAAFEVFEARQSFKGFSNSNLGKRGGVVYLETSGVPVLGEGGRLLGYRGADTDVSDRRRAEMETQRLRQELALFSRVATVNELTASIAHELNQPLAAILTNAQAALRFMQRGDPDLNELREILDDIVADNRRAADVIRSMRPMLRRSGSERQPLSLNGLITDVLPILRNDALIRKISVVLDLGSPMPSVEGNRVQLQQLLLNLVVNAFEAMEASEEPREVMLRTRQAYGEIVLDVKDSGSGIPADNLNSIFEPFFTTKTAGLGMGLSLSQSIVTAHHGRLWAENNPERGATFHVVLPASSE